MQRKVSMRILTYNTRGLGCPIKWKSIRSIVLKEEVQLLCVQETKKEDVTKVVCYAMWGNHEVEWSLLPSEGLSRGVFCLWDTNSFFRGLGYLGLEGVWKENGIQIVIVNIYDSCD